MKVYIVRHGETDYNKNKVFQGQIDSHLTEEGIRQAKDLAERLKDCKITKIYCSTLTRARDTAKIISDVLKADVVETPLLKEQSLGIWEDKNKQQVIKDLKDKYGSLMDKKEIIPPEGEGFEQVEERAIPFIEKAIKESSGNLLVVGHALLNRVIIGYYLGMDYFNRYKLFQKNCHLNILNVSKDGSIKVEALNTPTP
ncbi:MAG TPA: histidine phosphatase family protein [Candidatus Nanoarchaeia archaeon]|nr:histidine phosphatase family protein [Candidatus Nanoarchaeia archaeon]